jgi:hypothetical protein
LVLKSTSRKDARTTKKSLFRAGYRLREKKL